MSNLKEQLDNYTETPDTKVWDSISRTISLRRIRTAGIIAGAAIVAGVGIAIALNNSGAEATDMADATVAQPAMATPSQLAADNNESLAVVSTPTATAAPTTAAATKPAATKPADVKAATQVSAEVASQPVQPATAAVQPAAASMQETVVADKSNVEPVFADAVGQNVPLRTVNDLLTDNLPVIDEEPAALDAAVQNIPPEHIAQPQAKNTTDTVNEQQNLWIPNAIRPNDDNENNRYFKPIFTKPDEVDHFEMHIFARGGHRIYSTKRLGDQGWDGKSEGKYVPTGVYVYLITYRDASRIVRQKRGTVTVIYNK